jgi:hypothetical protein
MIKLALRAVTLLGLLLLAGCAANQMPGFENTYYSYNVPQTLLDRVMLKFREHGLVNARITRDNVGRVRLTGSYRNEDEVDNAFIIVQSIVGIKSTSPFYPENIKEKRWEIEAGKALVKYAKISRIAPVAPPKKRALVIGINTFYDSNISSIQGEDDAFVVTDRAEKAGYTVTALLGKNATKSNIEAALRKIDMELGPNDSLFIYISSHGTQPVPSYKGGDDRKMSILAWDSSTGNEVGQVKDKTSAALNIQKTSVSDISVQQLGKKKTRNTRILIDTCYSGEMLKDRAEDESSRYIRKTNGGQPEYASIAMSSWTGAEYTSKGINFNDDSAPASSVKEKRKSSQRDASRESSNQHDAYTIITATSAGEESLGPPVQSGIYDFAISPGRRLKGTFFTQSFFAYLDDYKGQIEPAFEAAKKFTQQKARDVSNNSKHQIPRRYSTLPADQDNLYQ